MLDRPTPMYGSHHNEPTAAENKVSLERTTTTDAPDSPLLLHEPNSRRGYGANEEGSDLGSSFKFKLCHLPRFLQAIVMLIRYVPTRRGKPYSRLHTRSRGGKTPLKHRKKPYGHRSWYHSLQLAEVAFTGDFPQVVLRARKR